MNVQLQGFIACAIACIGFGSNYLPAKSIGIHDGQLFNACMACGIMTIGLAQWAYMDFYKFEPFAAFGGALWALGNLLVPLILERCGLGPSQLTWGLSQILVGWATGKFGLFGKIRDEIANPILNYMGVGMLMISLALFSQMRPSPEAAAEAGVLVEDCRTVSLQRAEEASAAKSPLQQTARDLEGARLNRGGRCQGGHPLGFFCAIVAGALFGSTFDPPTYLKQLGEADARAGLPLTHSVSDMEYVVSHFVGIIAVTVVAFIIRLFVARQRTFVGSKVVLPGIGAGLVWGIAQVSWFKANGCLSYVVSFPIIVGVPGVIASLWGCFLFKENRGCWNRSLLVAVIVVQGVAVTCIALSKGS